MQRRERTRIEQVVERHRLQRRVQGSSATEFFDVLTGPELLDLTDAHLPEHRERLYPPTVTLSMFLRQALAADPSCQQAVNAWAVSRAADGLAAQSVRTGGYCRARARLPLSMVQALTRESGRALSARAPRAWGWRGRRVTLLDGTGFSMPDTIQNQARFPQPGCQAPGVGFPLARLCALIDLSSGAVLEAATGPHRGSGNSELDLSRTLLPGLCCGDLLLADALYANYFLVAQLIEAGVDVLFEQHGSRNTDFRCGQRLGVRDHVVHWIRPRRPTWMPPEQYAAAPERLTLREAQVGGRILVTTLLDAGVVHKAELDELYRRRWHIELDLRCIKTTLGMDVLRCRTPAMIEKELWVYLLAYNLMRVLMAEAAASSGQMPRHLSFKHTVQLWNAWNARACVGKAEADLQRLFELIAAVRVGHRPGRCEPRARKRRPKSFPWLKVPRDVARRRNLAHPTWRRVKVK
jgi:hypothetical protein